MSSGRESRYRGPRAAQMVSLIYKPRLRMSADGGPGWCSGPSYDPVTVVTRVQIPPRALSVPQTHFSKPGWCSGPSYDPVTVVTRVQIPPRAYFSMNYSLSAESRLGAAVILVNTPKGIEPDDEREKRATSARFKSRLGRFSDFNSSSEASRRQATASDICERWQIGFEPRSEASDSEQSD
jgi:hypothetical protein